ncbi:apolipoprotein N-acyltransferase [Massilia glaciei]|uniref:Apolipoprotein N-acyltransferase n=1 Tax=Massilia glaciei TaxID=1524097 RepID=A0A2U2HF78_9BURK|nr:apolipoprotein N-acyltransferase [Massilia glaciei]PWF42684.1 apolipoprotein N-acyltransferase [Massilia glaciei]
MLRRLRTAPTEPVAPVRSARGTALPMLFASLAGAASVLSLAPVGWWPIQFLTFAFLFYQVGMDTSVRRSTLVGWAFGFGWSVAGMHWLYIALTRFGGLAAPLAVVALCLLGTYMGLFGALATGAATWLRRRWSLPVAAFVLLVLPFCWGLSEWMRGWVFTGFPWAASGYAHNGAPLGGFAPLVGVYGIGVLAALCGACLVMLTQRRRVAAVGIMAALLAGGHALRMVEWTHPQGAPISVRLVQGNISQSEKFTVEHLGKILGVYHDLVTAAPADLIATPETAIPIFPHQLPEGYLEGMAAYAGRTNSHLLLGIPLMDPDGRYTNSVLGIARHVPPYRFDKAHLVPFGEFVPPGFRWFIDLMRIPLGDNKRGAPLQGAFAVKDQLVLPNVCYEDVFGEEIAHQLRSAARPATMLLNVSNLAWYGESVAIAQHLQMSQMRSLETGRPMLRATNTGATAVIDARGEVQARLAPYVRGTLAATVQGMAGMTPYILLGNYLLLALAALSFAAAWLLGRRYRTSSEKNSEKSSEQSSETSSKTRSKTSLDTASKVA